MNHLFKFQRMRHLVLTPAMLLVALLPLTALSACGGDTSDISEDGGPTADEDSERTTSGEGSEPEATRQPSIALHPAAQTSPETDRETPIALYNATDGENWDDNNN